MPKSSLTPEGMSQVTEKRGLSRLWGRDAPGYCLRFARLRVRYSELSSARNAIVAMLVYSGMGMLLRSR